MVVFGVVPQAGVDRIGAIFMVSQKAIGLLAPDNFALRVLQLQCFGRVNEPLHSQLGFPSIAKIKHRINSGIDLGRDCRRGFYIRGEGKLPGLHLDGRGKCRQKTCRQHQHAEFFHILSSF